VQLAARLRQTYPSGVDVETFESYRKGKARRKVLSLLDTNHNRTLTSDEKQNARIIIYGHSWGGAEAIALARELQKDGIAVRLTIQVDSISRIRQDDAVIPQTSPGLPISISHTDFSTASPEFTPLIPPALTSSGIFASTTKRALIHVTRIPGTIASLPGLTPRLSVIPGCGSKWSR